MKEIIRHENTHILRFDKGEEVLTALQKFCAENEIKAGTFWGLGAARGLILADYNLDKKEYRTAEYSEMLEIASLTGNVAVADGKTMLHVHGVFSTLEKVYAGHVQKLVVGVTCEMTLLALPGTIVRTLNPDIGLKLLAG